MIRVMRVLVYEYESRERADRDMEHWNLPQNEVYNVTPFDSGRQPGSGMRIHSRTIELGEEE